MPEEKRTKIPHYPSYICLNCGEKHCNGLTKNIVYASTFHMGVCDICGETSALTQPRDYGHLTQRAIKMYQKAYEKSLRKKS